MSKDPSSFSSKLERLDIVLVLLYLALVVFGWMDGYSAVHIQEISAFSFELRSGKQLLWIGLSLVTALCMVGFIPHRFYETLAVPIYLLSLMLLVAVLLVGTSVNGSHSWIVLGPVSFQPAEIVKISTALLLAKAMSAYGFDLKKRSHFLRTCGIILLPIALILMENETGCALVLLGFIIPLYREGLSGWYIVLAFTIVLLFILTLTISPLIAILISVFVGTLSCEYNEGSVIRWCYTTLPAILAVTVWVFVHDKVLEPGTTAAAILKPANIMIAGGAVGVFFYIRRLLRNLNPFRLFSLGAILLCIVFSLSVNFIFNHALQEHQRQRIEVLLGMKEDVSGAGYNLHQSLIAIGSGGLNGKGFLHGTQTTYGFVPEQSTDFIFCTVGEEWGFVGCTFVIVLYALMIFWIIQDAEKAREAYTRIYGYCLACCLFMHLFINIGMTVGLMPVIGIPLPFLSYGGSSLWAFTTMLFIFLALNRQENKYF